MFSKLPQSRCNESSPSLAKCNTREQSSTRCIPVKNQAKSSTEEFRPTVAVSQRSIASYAQLSKGRITPTNVSSETSTKKNSRPCSGDGKQIELQNEPQQGRRHRELERRDIDRKGEKAITSASKISSIGKGSLVSTIPKARSLSSDGRNHSMGRSVSTPPSNDNSKKDKCQTSRVRLNNALFRESSSTLRKPIIPPQQENVDKKQSKETSINHDSRGSEASKIGMPVPPINLENELVKSAVTEAHPEDCGDAGTSQEIISELETKMKSLLSEALEFCRELIEKYDDILRLLMTSENSVNLMQIDNLKQYEEELKIRYRSIVEKQNNTVDKLQRSLSEICCGRDSLLEIVRNNKNEIMNLKEVNHDMENKLGILVEENKALTESKANLTEWLEQERKNNPVLNEKKLKYSHMLKNLKSLVEKNESSVEQYDQCLMKLNSKLKFCLDEIHNKDILMEKSSHKHQRIIEEMTQKYNLENEKLVHRIAELQHSSATIQEEEKISAEQLAIELKLANERLQSAETKRKNMDNELYEKGKKLALTEKRCITMEKQLERLKEIHSQEGICLSLKSSDESNAKRDWLLAEPKSTLKNAKEKTSIPKSQFRNNKKAWLDNNNVKNKKLEAQTKLKQSSAGQDNYNDSNCDMNQAIEDETMNETNVNEPARLLAKLSKLSCNYQDALKQVSILTEELAQRDQSLHEQSELVKIRDSIITMFKNRGSEVELGGLDNSLQKLTWKDLCSILEKKQVALMTLETKVEGLEKMYASNERQRVRQEARIKTLESALYEKCSMDHGLVPVLVQSASAR